MGVLKIRLFKRMPRGYRRSTAVTRRTRYARAVSNRAKYSIETSTSNVALTNLAVDGTSLYGVAPVVAATTIQGMRKVKHMQVSVCLQHGAAAQDIAGGAPILWALVYVPQGQATIPAPATSGSIYEPNQFVIASGIADADAGPIRINTPLARNLNSGDSIQLTYRLLNGTVVGNADATASIVTMVRYAITLN